MSDDVLRNEKGTVCGLCDGTHAHEHQLQPKTKENTMKTTATESNETKTAPAPKFSLMIFDPNGYSSRAKTIGFETDTAARTWAEKYLEAYPHQSLFLVEGKAEVITAPKSES